MAPLTGIAFAINWLISKLNLNRHPVKTTGMTTKLKRWLIVSLKLTHLNNRYICCRIAARLPCSQIVNLK